MLHAEHFHFLWGEYLEHVVRSLGLNERFNLGKEEEMQGASGWAILSPGL